MTEKGKSLKPYDPNNSFHHEPYEPTPEEIAIMKEFLKQQHFEKRRREPPPKTDQRVGAMRRVREQFKSRK